MSSISERKANRRELIKAICHTHIKNNGEATAKQLEHLINGERLLKGSVSAEQISNILSRSKRDNKERFKTDNGVWRLNV